MWDRRGHEHFYNATEGFPNHCRAIKVHPEAALRHDMMSEAMRIYANGFTWCLNVFREALSHRTRDVGTRSLEGVPSWHLQMRTCAYRP